MLLSNASLIVAGLVLLFFGGEFLVRGCVTLAERFGLSNLLISLIVVGFGTSMPELLVSIDAALGGTPDVALGNIVGSSIANILLIIGCSALIYPITKWHASARREAVAAALFTVVAYGLMAGGMIGFFEGVIGLILLFVYLYITYRIEKASARNLAQKEAPKQQAPADWRAKYLPFIFAIGGMIALVVGADILVEGAVALAKEVGVSDAVIGLSIVALGTSLPELATGISAAIRKQSDVVLGNVIGSNIFNLIAIPGITALIVPVAVDKHIISVDMPLVLAVSLGLVALLFFFTRISKGIGAVMIAGYGAYIISLF